MNGSMIFNKGVVILFSLFTLALGIQSLPIAIAQTCPHPLAVVASNPQQHVTVSSIFSDRYLVYVVEKQGELGNTHDVYSVPLDGSRQPIQLYDGNAAGGLRSGVFEVVANNTKIVLEADYGEVFVAYPATGGVERITLVPQGSQFVDLVHSSAGDMLFTVMRNDDRTILYRTSLNDMQPVLVADDIVSNGSLGDFFLWEEHVIYRGRNADGQLHLYAQPLETGRMRVDLSDGMPIVEHPLNAYVLSRDHALFFVRREGLAVDLYSTTIVNGEPVFLAALDYLPNDVQISPDGIWVVYQENLALMRVKIDGTQPPRSLAALTSVGLPPQAHPATFAIAPDSTWVALMDDRSAYRIDLNSTSSERLATEMPVSYQARPYFADDHLFVSDFFPNTNNSESSVFHVNIVGQAPAEPILRYNLFGGYGSVMITDGEENKIFFVDESNGLAQAFHAPLDDVHDHTAIGCAVRGSARLIALTEDYLVYAVYTDAADMFYVMPRDPVGVAE
jgi:hypothetical protein